MLTEIVGEDGWRRFWPQERNVPDSLPRTLGRSSGQSFPDLSDGEVVAQIAPLITNLALSNVLRVNAERK